MAKEKRKKISIRSRILLSVLSLICAIIIGIAISFNLLVDKYIADTSSEKLKEAQKIMFNFDSEHLIKPSYENHGVKEPVENDNIKGFEEKVKKVKSQAEVQVLLLNENYNIIFPTTNITTEYGIDNYYDIVEELKENNIDLNSDFDVRLTTDNSSYYVSSVNINNIVSSNNEFLIFFIDISDTLLFARQINMTLIIVMGIAGVLALGVAIVVSKKIARPIQDISQFAQKLGEGNFNKCEINFCDKEINELADVMNKAAEDLDKYDKEQKIFFQNVSHELRTPLMSIKGYAEAIKYNVLDKDSASDVILEETDRLVDLIEELLYVSKIDNITKDYILVEHDMREILSNCTVKQKVRAIKLGIQFKYDFDNEAVLVKCDEKSIYRAYLNIIENALRYAKSEIIISCKKVDGKVIIAIEDDGNGIKESDLPHIFDRFYKGEKGKHGIGLSIVKAIIEKHKGSIYAENTELGAKFNIIF